MKTDSKIMIARVLYNLPGSPTAAEITRAARGTAAAGPLKALMKLGYVQRKDTQILPDYEDLNTGETLNGLIPKTIHVYSLTRAGDQWINEAWDKNYQRVYGKLLRGA